MLWYFCKKSKNFSKRSQKWKSKLFLVSPQRLWKRINFDWSKSNFCSFVDCKLFYVFTGLTHFYQSWPNDFSNVFRIAWSLSNEIRGWNMLHNLIHVLDVSYFQKLLNSVKEDSNENYWSIPPSMSCFPMTRAVDPVAQLLFTFWWQENNKTIWY